MRGGGNEETYDKVWTGYKLSPGRGLDYSTGDQVYVEHGMRMEMPRAKPVVCRSRVSMPFFANLAKTVVQSQDGYQIR